MQVWCRFAFAPFSAGCCDVQAVPRADAVPCSQPLSSTTATQKRAEPKANLRGGVGQYLPPAPRSGGAVMVLLGVVSGVWGVWVSRWVSSRWG